ncbi:prefoldin subunit [bacterium]|jgi:prefoldin beta subunit|nr:prefoldin subunit [Euryarchaeota archaeon]MDB4602539.1 prefoldin subunit [Euryarchaeota archaeon]MDC3258604.1 prefoldin subunit [bacterium]MDG1542514.1 prefoldin subunit [Candidatus Thalassarchaeaceae archaeon]|tara:strand:+ start:273 stop:587 length:315 start_codon:yes stop_codon:yes gene_type:complete
MSELDSPDFQALVQELQLVRNQIQTVSTQVNEISLTLESLSTQDTERPVFRAVGNLLLEVDDRDKLMKELSDSKVTFETHLQRMIERETELRTQYEKVIDSVEK